jgi:hypothetical protein
MVQVWTDQTIPHQGSLSEVALEVPSTVLILLHLLMVLTPTLLPLRLMALTPTLTILITNHHHQDPSHSEAASVDMISLEDHEGSMVDQVVEGAEGAAVEEDDTEKALNISVQGITTVDKDHPELEALST